LKEKAMPLMSQPPDDDQSPPSDAPRANQEERDAMLRDTELIASISEIVRRCGVPDADNEDVVQVTLLAAHKAEGLPKDPAERVQYVHGITRNKAAGHRRKARRSPDVEPGVEVEHIAQAVDADPVAERNLLSRLESVVPAGQMETWRCLARNALGEDLAEIARDVGIQYDTLYKRVTTLKRQLRENAKRMGAGFAMVLLLLGLSRIVLRPPRMGDDTPGPAHVVESATSTHAAEPDPMDVARAVRGRAFRACMNNQWKACLEDLDLAAQIDPNGDNEPTVRAARTDAEDGIQHDENGKPGDRWAPPKVRLYAGLAAR
jgi:DNA-directed RNA polymerase specialized sigma24 family protein